jgi:putative transposase
MIPEGQDRLYAYIASILRNKRCYPYKINGTEDHLHIVSSLLPAMDVSDLIKDIKISTGLFIRKNKLFPGFSAWQEGYSSFTYSRSALKNLIRYVENQKEHHKAKSYVGELIELYDEHGIAYDIRHL